MIEINNSIKKTLKKRNIQNLKTRKLLTDFKGNPTKYLTFKEVRQMTKNENNQNWIFQKIKKAIIQNPTFKELDTTSQSKIIKYNNECIKAYDNKKYKKYMKTLKKTVCRNCLNVFNFDNNLEFIKKFGKEYTNYYISLYKDIFELLNIDKLSKKFSYFDLTDVIYSPDKENISFCIDVIGEFIN